MKLKELQEKRGSLLKQCRTTIDIATTEARGLTAEEQTRLTGLEGEIDAVNTTLSAEMRQLARESQQLPQLSTQEKRDVDRFDIGIALRGLANGTPFDGVVAEMLQEGEREARAARIEATGGIMLPSILTRRENRAMTATGTTTIAGDQGGMTVPTVKRGLMDDFFNGSVIRLLGATVLEGLTGNLDLPRLTAGTTPAKKGENASADAVSPLTAMLSLSPKRLPAYIDLSQQLLLQSNDPIEALIRMHLTNQMLAVQEAAFFHGSGTLEANGIIGTAGVDVTSVAGGTNGLAPTFAMLIALETAVDTQNAIGGNLHYASNGQIRGKLKTTLKNPAGTDSGFILSDSNPGVINGYGAQFTNAISRTLTKGTSSLASAIFFGNFADYVVGYWGGLQLELIRDSTNAKTGTYTLVANTYYDGGVVRPKSFAVMKDALGA